MPFLSEEYAEYDQAARQPHTIKCRGCGKTEEVTDDELDVAWAEYKTQYPKATRQQALNVMCFCKKCSGMSDDTTIHAITPKVSCLATHTYDLSAIP